MKPLSNTVSIIKDNGFTRDNINDMMALTAGMKGNDRVNIDNIVITRGSDAAKTGNTSRLN